MFNRTYTGPAISRVNRELERALKEVARREEKRENREEIEGVVGSEGRSLATGLAWHSPSHRHRMITSPATASPTNPPTISPTMNLHMATW